MSTPSAGTLVQRSLSQAVATLLANDAVVREDQDVEGVHQMRVAIRNLRSQLQVFAALLDEVPSSVTDDLHWMFRLLGRLRDLDVLHEVVDDALSAMDAAAHHRARFILTLIADEREQRQTELGAAMSTDRYLVLLVRLTTLANAPSFTRRAEQGAAEVLLPIARHAYRRLHKATRRARPADAHVDAVHRVRIRAKQFRCVLDSVSDVLPAASRQAKALSRLQRVLGSINDATNAAEWLQNSARAETDPARSVVLGELAMEFGRRSDVQRSHWYKAWKRVRSPRRSAWLHH